MAGDPEHSSDAEADGQPPPALVAQAEAIAANEQSTTEASEVLQGKASDSKQDSSSVQRRHVANLLYEMPVEEAPPPAYSESYGLVDMSQLGLSTRANVANDGRLDITINQKSRRLSNLLVPALQSRLNLQAADEAPALPPGYVPQALSGFPGAVPPPPMNVVIHVVGSRGDVQPFVALGKVLKATFGHRVRLATHPVFRNFIEENGLEFFSIGGDPAELMAFMVKNPGLMPGKDALRSGDIGKRRKGMYEIIQGCWRSCFETGDGTGVEVSDSNIDDQIDTAGEATIAAGLDNKPFVADAIIANPPSFAHVHCAEKLGVPLHLMFTMPWSPTQAFPHPLANIQSSNADVSMTNFITYALVEMMTWQGLGDIINRFREKSLGLEPVSMMWAPGMVSRLRIPFTYCCYRPREYDSDDGPWEPISGGASALLGTLGSLMMGIADFPVEIFKAFASKSLEDRGIETATTKLLALKRNPNDEQSDIAQITATSLSHSPSSSTINLASPAQKEGRPITPDDHDLSGTTSHGLTSTLVSSRHGNNSQAQIEIQSQDSETGAVKGEWRSGDSPKLGQERKNPSRHPFRASPEKSPQISFDTALGAGKGVSRIVGAGLKSPMDFTLGLAKGFHNAPKLYGDSSVRQADKITGFQSGLRAAGKEFGYGFYDGISGLVTQPLEGAKKEGIAGLLKGFGKGIGGVVLKPGAAIWGLPGYTFKGIYKELQKHLGSSVQNYIIAARTAQGYEDLGNSSQEERADIITRWHAAQDELGKQKRQWGNRRPRTPQPDAPKNHTSDAWAKQKVNRMNKTHEEETLPSTTDPTGSMSDQAPSISSNDFGISPYEKGLEGAVHKSFADTSRGNADEDSEEDAMIARAIRASELELQRGSEQGDDHDTYQRVIQASIAEASRIRPQPMNTQCQEPSTSYGQDAELEAGLHKIVYGRDGVDEPQRYHLNHDWDDPGVETDDDENIKLALDQSKQSLLSRASKEYEDLQTALRQSRDDHEEHEQAKSKAQLEEEIVLKYIKKQSLAEKEHARKLAANSGSKDGG